MYKFIYKKKFLGIFWVLFFLMGILVESRNISYEDIKEVNSEAYVQLDSTHVITQKLLGNDHYITSFSVFVKDKEILKDSKVDVYLMQGSRELVPDNIVSQITLTADLLEKDIIECKLNENRLKYNRDYYIVLKYEQVKNEGFLDIYISTNGINSPVYINDINTGVSLAYDLKCISYKTQFSFVWEFVFIFMSCMMAYAVFRKKQLVDSFAVVPLMLSVIVYLLAILGLLGYSIYICLIIACLCFGYVVIKLFQMEKNELEEVITKETICQIICWGFLLLFCIIGNKGKCVIESDPFTHWAFSVENIYMFDKLPFHAQSNMNNFRYPPLYSLFQYLCMKIYGNWSESILYFSKDFLLGSIIIGCCSSKRLKNVWDVIFALIIGIGIPELFFNGNVLASIYVDEILGVVFGYTLICIYRMFYKSEKCIGEIFLAILSLGLIKESGLILGAILIFTVILILFTDQINLKIRWKVELRHAGICLFAIVLAYTTWHIYMALNVSKVTATTVSMNNNIVAAAGVSSNGIVEYLLGQAPEYKYQIIGIHLQKLFFDGYYKNSFGSMPFVGCLLIILLMIYCLTWINKKERNTNYKVIWTIFISALLYICFLHVAYTFSMTEREALMCASEDRYLGSFLLGSFMLAIYMFYIQIESCEWKEAKKAVTYVLLGVFVLITTNQCMHFRQEVIDKNDIYEYTQNMRDDSHKLRHYLEEGKDVFYLSDMENVGYYMYYNYDLLPIRSGHYGFPVDKSIWEPIYDLTVDELACKIQGYEYVYIRTTRKLFNEKYSELFVDPDGIEDGSLYRRQEDGLLVKVF